MANLKEYEKLTIKERQYRNFSEDFKRKKVSELDRNLISIAELCREHQVSSTSVYKWIYAYSTMRKKGLRQVIEAKSDSHKLMALREEMKELQRIIGEKQIRIDFQEKLIDMAEREYKVDIKKKLSGKLSSGIGLTGRRIK
jgi:transposase